MAVETQQGGAQEAEDATKIVGASPRAFKARIDQTKTKRRELLRDWQLNVDYRRGKFSDLDSDDNRISVPMDWAATKSKVSQLFSQLPQTVLTGAGPYQAAAPVVQKRLNWRLDKAKVGAAMDEAFPDAVNAAGFGVVMAGYESREEMRQVPAVPDEMLGQMDKLLIGMGLKQREMKDEPYIVDRRFFVDRVSPDSFLWPLTFKRSDFDFSPWIGHSGTKAFAEALALEWVTEDEKDTVCGDSKAAQDRLTTDGDEATYVDDDVVGYDEIFYWRYLYHPEEKHFCAIQHMVFVEGKTEPVINEPWKGQRYDEEIGTYIGARRFPIRVLTLNYISDEALPPSDSAIGRPQVKELMKYRSDLSEQRDHSKPLRWYNTDRIDADIQTLIMQGDWNGFIPVQGDGTRAIGEVARSNYPRDNYEGDKVIKGDLMEAWSIGPNQGGAMAASGEHSASEARIVQGNFATRIAQERARGVAFFLGVADVMLGLMCLYDDFELPDPKDGERLMMWDRTRISHELAFSVRGDSTVLLDAGQRIDRIAKFLNLTGKSGYVNPKPIIEELAALSGLDPSEVVVEPPQKGPEKPNVSFRFSGEDMMNPIALGTAIKGEVAPGPEEIQAAAKMIAAGMALLPPPIVSGKPTKTSDSADPMADDRPDWSSVDRVNSRRDASQNSGEA